MRQQYEAMYKQTSTLDGSSHLNRTKFDIQIVIFNSTTIAATVPCFLKHGLAL